MISTFVAVTILAVAALIVALTPRLRAALRLSSPDVRVVCDLDAILTETVGFRFEGKIYEIPPLSLQQFVLAIQGLAVLDHLKQSEKVTPKELLDAYEGLFRLVCPKLTRKTIESMGHQRIGALLNLIIEVIMGKATLDAEKKSHLSYTAEPSHQPAPV